MTDAKKTILVTGGNRGIGREVCRQLAAQGAQVILTARDEQKGRAAAAELGTRFEPLDIGDYDSVRALADRLRTNGDRIDALINNAGTIEGAGYGKKVTDVERATLLQMLDVNSLGPLFLTQALCPLMPRGGIVVMVSSGAGVFCGGYDRQSGWYGVTKTMLNAITRRLALDLRAVKIQVNAVCPGWVKTDMGGENAERSVEKGAETIVWLANGNTSENGKFFRDKEVIDW